MSMRISEAFEESVLPPIVALLLAAVVGDVLIMTFGQSPGAVYRLLLEGTWGNAYGFGQVLLAGLTAGQQLQMHFQSRQILTEAVVQVAANTAAFFILAAKQVER